MDSLNTGVLKSKENALNQRKMNIIVDISEHTPVGIVADSYFEVVGYSLIFKDILKYIEQAEEDQIQKFEETLVRNKELKKDLY